MQEFGEVPESDLFDVVDVENLAERLGFSTPLDYPRASLDKPLTQWRMEDDDSPIFRYLYRHLAPRRHLEFGTWQGTGTTYCLEESEATVWTINVLEGCRTDEGYAEYGLDLENAAEMEAARDWARRMGLKEEFYTDRLGFIGRYYLQKNFGARVCQIYADSTQWDTRNYPDGFFDTVLIDGGHQPDVVAHDTLTALRLVRSGGVVLWHDFCPPVADRFEVVQGVTEGVRSVARRIREETDQLFWIRPSWILLGVKK